MIKVIFWMFVLVLALSFFGISIQSIFDSPAGQSNINYIVEVAYKLWDFVVAKIGAITSK